MCVGCICKKGLVTRVGLSQVYNQYLVSRILLIRELVIYSLMFSLDFIYQGLGQSSIQDPFGFLSFGFWASELVHGIRPRRGGDSVFLSNRRSLDPFFPGPPPHGLFFSVPKRLSAWLEGKVSTLWTKPISNFDKSKLNTERELERRLACCWQRPPRCPEA